MTLKKSTIGALALLVAFALIVAACGDDDATTTTGGGGATTGGTFRMETDGISYTGGNDPTGEYLGIAFGMFSNLTARTLLTYYHTGGAEGNSLVPDLATDFPVISEDGLTYTFTLKDGIMFGPPLSREITSHDIEFAFRRMATESLAAQYFNYFDRLVDGLTTYPTMPDDISGIETPDDKTIVFHLTRSAPEFVNLIAMPAASPMPEEVAGCFLEAGEYGRYLISSGPYMYEGSEALDASSCDALVASGPIAGFDPEDHAYFVRNPDYDASTDDPAVRANYVDKITIDLNTNAQDIYAKITAGELDGAVSSANPPSDVMQTYATDPSLADRFVFGIEDTTYYITMNLTVPPFDDVHVRKAANLIMDKAGILQAWGGDISGSIATHIQPPALAGLTDYDPYATEGHTGDLALAQAEMKLSKYDTNGDGMCDAPECSAVVLVNRQISPWIDAEAIVVDSFAKIGIQVEVRELEDHYGAINTVANRTPAGMNPRWGKDFPDSSSFVGFLFDGRGIVPTGNTNYSLVGLTQAQADELGIPYPADGVPSVDADIDACKAAALTGAQAGKDCWNALDRKLMEEIVPWVPTLWTTLRTIIGPAVTNWEFDQFAGTAAFSKLAVDPSKQG